MHDVVSQLLRDLRVESTVYCRIAVAEPWAVAYPPGDMAGFHVVLEGSCQAVVAGRDEPIPLEAGDLVVVPHGTPHVLRGRLPARAEEAETVVARGGGEFEVRHGGGGEQGAYLCGGFRFGAMHDHPLLSALPDVLHVPATRGDTLPWLPTHLAAIRCELSSGRPGAETVVSRLSEVLFVQAVRAHLAALPDGARGWAAAVREPAVARALSLMHRSPERAWTVEGLGRAVGMSRSVFAERFAATVGEPPLAYLAAWRMHRARTLLREGSTRTVAIARQLGYASEAAFSTAFKRWTGTTPGHYRRAARDELRPGRDAEAASGGTAVPALA